MCIFVLLIDERHFAQVIHFKRHYFEIFQSSSVRFCVTCLTKLEVCDKKRNKSVIIRDF